MSGVVDEAGEPGMGKGLTLSMAVATGTAVANIYYNQPLLGIMKDEFGSSGLMGFIATATQLGYAVGLFLLVPLGDLMDRRRLIVTQFALLAVALILTATAQSAGVLALASLGLGVCATVTQQVVPF